MRNVFRCFSQWRLTDLAVSYMFSLVNQWTGKSLIQSVKIWLIPFWRVFMSFLSKGILKLGKMYWNFWIFLNIMELNWIFKKSILKLPKCNRIFIKCIVKLRNCNWVFSYMWLNFQLHVTALNFSYAKRKIIPITSLRISRETYTEYLTLCNWKIEINFL